MSWGEHHEYEPALGGQRLKRLLTTSQSHRWSQMGYWYILESSTARGKVRRVAQMLQDDRECQTNVHLGTAQQAQMHKIYNYPEHDKAETR